MSNETKYNVPDGYWDEDDQDDESEETVPPVEVDRHTISILHRRDEGQDHQWDFYLEDGEVTGVGQLHRLANSNQFDPMGGTWGDVPTVVKKKLADELRCHVTDVDDYVDFDSRGVTQA